MSEYGRIKIILVLTQSISTRAQVIKENVLPLKSRNLCDEVGFIKRLVTIFGA